MLGLSLVSLDVLWYRSDFISHPRAHGSGVSLHTPRCLAALWDSLTLLQLTVSLSCLETSSL